MAIIQKIGAVLLAAAAAVVWFTMAPDRSTTHSAADGAVGSALGPYQSGSSHEDTSNDAIDAVLAGGDLNQATADSAPQQSVVNGWTSNDLLEVIARQGNEAMDQDAQNDQRLATDLRNISEVQSDTMQRFLNGRTDHRPAAFLGLGVLGLALLLFTSGTGGRKHVDVSGKEMPETAAADKVAALPCTDGHPQPDAAKDTTQERV